MLAPDRADPGYASAPGPDVADPLTSSVPEPGPGGHLGAVDLVRFVTVAGVILVHATALTISYRSVVAGAVYDLAHVTRSVFLLLSAFVLTYSFERRPASSLGFWRRRFPLVVTPYITWSLIYVVTDGDLRSPHHVVVTFLYDLVTGGAHFHLYFLLLTMQLYLAFPALMAALKRWPRALLPALGTALVFELVVTALIHYDATPSALALWFGHASSWLLTYPFFVVAGVAGAHYFREVTTWVRRRYRLVALSYVASVGLALTSYLVDLGCLGYSPLKASEVFQPALVLETITATAGQYALGVWLVDRRPTRYRRRLERSSDASFGVYLAHPLLIGAVLDIAVAAGLWHQLAGLPSGLGEALVAFGLVPFVYASSFLVVAAARRGRFSLALTGRRPIRGRPTPPGPSPTAGPALRWRGPTIVPPRYRASRR